MNFHETNKNFIVFATICCLLSVVTTIGIHTSLFNLEDLSKEETFKLYENPTYQLKRFWVILHCLFVLISMWGIFILQYRKSLGFMGLGLICFVVFSFTEIFRQMLVLFYLNNLRKSYLDENQELVKEIISVSIDHTGFIGYALFGLFNITFILGCIFYGIGFLRNQNRLDRILASTLLLYGIFSLIGFGNEFWKIKSISIFLGYFKLIYLPIMRFLLFLWLALYAERGNYLKSIFQPTKPTNSL